jgi:hypothetical protein
MKILSFIFLFLYSLIPGWFSNVDGDYQEHPESVAHEEFINLSIQYYDSYFVLKDKITTDYVYTIVLGVKDNNQYYDVFLYNIKKSSYVLRIKIGDDEYSVTNAKEGCYYQNGIINNGKNDVKVYMFNGYSKIEEVTIPSDYSSFSKTVTPGNGYGVVVSYLEPVKGFNENFASIILIATVLIFACLIALGVVFVLRKGKKNIGPATYKEEPNLFNYYKYTQPSGNNDEEDVNRTIEVEVVTDDINKVDDMQIEEPLHEKSFYEEVSEFKNNSSGKEESEETKKEQIDITTLLMMKGYRTDYENLSLDQKNEVMVGLMILKNTNQIDDDTYYKEVAKLWKN